MTTTSLPPGHVIANSIGNRGPCGKVIFIGLPIADFRSGPSTDDLCTPRQHVLFSLGHVAIRANIADTFGWPAGHRITG
jgi:hypothetical protein